ncbi:MAG: carboxypeptidase regulatory-like domain-containing protein [Pyrinomonadaceae bacterium]|nr:carboxypeptidase regulatory-like domain-containing protein [Pyrinomonadaceae bacterium]
MFKPLIVFALAFYLPFNGLFGFLSGSKKANPNANTGTLEMMIVSKGNVSLDLDLEAVNGFRSRGKMEKGPAQFQIEKDSYFKVVAFENELRGALPGSMALNPENFPELPAKLSESYKNLVLERAPFGEHHEMVIRDAKLGFKFFNIEGHLMAYEPNGRTFQVKGGRVLMSNDFAATLGRPDDAGKQVGTISVDATLKVIEVAEIADGGVEKQTLPPDPDNAGTRPGPDVVVGDVFGLTQFGSSGDYVGLALGTTSCNYGTVDLNWFRLPNNDHPVIPQNMYRMSANGDRFEQIGQSSVKHAFTALTQNLCQLGCNGTGGSRLGSGCSDPYSAGLNAGPNLGHRAWINPFDGFYPDGNSATPPNNHSGHSHDSTTHRILTHKDDLNVSLNSGATYYAEGQYITPHEYDHCQSNPGECNMYNNVSYRQYGVSGTTSFSFSPIGSTVREAAAIEAWTGATFVPFEPVPGVDGTGIVAYKVTQINSTTWHYEYAVYNENLDRAIGSFAVSKEVDASATSIGFHSPPQHPGTANDGTGGSGFSESPWTASTSDTEVSWSTELFATNANANAIRWGTLYNFRFESNQPPVLGDATIGFFKTGSPITVQVMRPNSGSVAGVSVAGRVTTQAGTPAGRTAVAMIAPGGEITWTLTNPFGFFNFTDVTPGFTYDVVPSSKLYTFTAQQVEVNGNITGVNFVGVPRTDD